jgi:hypothetical protein
MTWSVRTVKLLRERENRMFHSSGLEHDTLVWHMG